MLEAATSLMQAGATPSVSEVAEAAGVSRATAYRYFPSQAVLVHAVVDEALGPILDWEPDAADTRARVEDLLASSMPRINEFEATFKAALKLSLDQWARRQVGTLGAEPQFTRGHRVDLLMQATEPMADRLSRGQRQRLTQALSLVFGVELIIVLRDIWGLGGKRGRGGRAMGRKGVGQRRRGRSRSGGRSQRTGLGKRAAALGARGWGGKRADRGSTRSAPTSPRGGVDTGATWRGRRTSDVPDIPHLDLAESEPVHMREKNMRKSIAGLLAGVSFMTVGVVAVQAQELTILWAEWDPANYLQELVNEYQAETGVTVTVETVPWPDFQTKLFTELNAQGSAYDLVVGDSQFLGAASTGGHYVESHRLRQRAQSDRRRWLRPP